jgi:hypothetical protein
MSCGYCNDGTITSTCGNPCGASAINSATCETIPSQIENFTIHFFGSVTKTEVNGQVSWTLPCNLEVGLPNNPRIEGEGLACYFLRLFNDGIIGATGPQGDPGEDGDPGKNAFTVTLASFTQPTLASPYVQVLTSYNPSILVGLYVFIGSSGYYLVTATDPSGNVWLTLIEPLGSAPATITAGKLVVPSGPPGQSIVGLQGPAGAPGPQGSPGSSYTAENEFYYADAGTDFHVQALPQQVIFVSSTPEVTLSSGTWLITATIEVLPDPSVAISDVVNLRLRDLNTVGDLPGSGRRVSGMNANRIENVTICIRYSPLVSGTTIGLIADLNGGVSNRAYIVATGAQIVAVKLEN